MSQWSVRFAKASSGSSRTRLFTILALCTGARMGAILGLDWERVDLERRVIDYHDPKRPKTKKGRAVVPINDALHAALVAARPNPATGPVIRWGGQRIKDIRKSLVKAAKAVGVHDVTPHTLRHTFATHAAMRGVPMQMLSRVLGHKSTKTTEEVYVKYDPNYLRPVVDAAPLGGRDNLPGTKYQTPGTESEHLDTPGQAGTSDNACKPGVLRIVK